MLWTKTNSLKGLNLGLMNIHQRLSLIGPLFPRGKPIGDAAAGSEEPDKAKESHKTSDLLLTCQLSLYYDFYISMRPICGSNTNIKTVIFLLSNEVKQHYIFK